MIFKKKLVLSLLFVLLYGAIPSHCAKKKDKVECYVDDEGPRDDPNNIYLCKAGSKCCKENAQPSCCTPKPMDVSIMDQVKLWGTLAALIFVLALIMWCCRSDGECCCTDKDGHAPKCLHCIPCCRPKERAPLMHRQPEVQEVFYMDDDFYVLKENKEGLESVTEEGKEEEEKKEERKNSSKVSPKNVQKDQEDTAYNLESLLTN